ncbi:MAG: VPLPA-CTERM sorting domain-containing protein [Pseudomonadota bacterium]
MRALIVTLSLAVAAFGPAHAAQISASDIIRPNAFHFFDPPSGAPASNVQNLPNEFSLPRFDPQLGRLNFALFEFTAIFGVRTNAESIERGNAGPLTLQARNRVTPAFFLTLGPGNAPLITVNDITPVLHTCTIPRNGSCTIQETTRRIAFGDRVLAGQGALNFLTGSGQYNVPIRLRSLIETRRIDETLVTYVFRPAANIPGLLAPRVRLKVTYDFVPIPLPASGAVLLAGIGALTVIRRRKTAKAG